MRMEALVSGFGPCLSLSCWAGRTPQWRGPTDWPCGLTLIRRMGPFPPALGTWGGAMAGASLTVTAPRRGWAPWGAG